MPFEALGFKQFGEALTIYGFHCFKVLNNGKFRAGHARSVYEVNRNSGQQQKPAEVSLIID